MKILRTLWQAIVVTFFVIFTILYCISMVIIFGIGYIVDIVKQDVLREIE